MSKYTYLTDSKKKTTFRKYYIAFLEQMYDESV